MHSTQLRRCLRRVCLTFPPPLLVALVDGWDDVLGALGVVLPEASLLGDALGDIDVRELSTSITVRLCLLITN